MHGRNGAAMRGRDAAALPFRFRVSRLDSRVSESSPARADTSQPGLRSRLHIVTYRLLYEKFELLGQLQIGGGEHD